MYLKKFFINLKHRQLLEFFRGGVLVFEESHLVTHLGTNLT